MGRNAHATRTIVLGAVLALGLLSLAPPASATHLSCGDSVSGNVELDDDLLGCPGNGLDVDADNTTIDLKGNTIDGTGSGVGIFVDGFKRVTITSTQSGAVIQDFNIGIQFNNTKKSKILGGAGLVVDGNAHGGIFLRGSSKNRVEDVIVTDNGFDADPDAGIELDHIDGVGSNKNRVVGNTVTGNGDDGVDINESNKNKIIDNTLSNNGDEGIELEGANKTVVKNNTISSNGEIGIEIEDDAKKNKIKNNLIQGNGNDGVELHSGASRNVIKGNVTGVHPDPLVGGSGNIDDGIKVGSDAGSKNKLVKNTANGNGDDGIDVEVSSTKVSNNIANDNVNNGIIAEAGTKGGGNTATNNGIADCTPADLC